MSLSHLPRRLFGRSRKIVDPQQHRRRLTMEQFEERVLPATLTVTTLANTDSGGLLSLRQAILDSIDHTNTDSPVTGTGDDTIEFASSLFTSAPQTITLTTEGNTTITNSALGITGDSSITIIGPTGTNGLTISQSGVGRLFFVASGSSLTLENLTLSNGKAQGAAGSTGQRGGGGGAGLGGAILNEGTLAIVASTLSGNSAVGGAGGGSNFAISAGGVGGGPNAGAGGHYGAGSAGGFASGGGGQGYVDRGGGAGGFGGGGGSKYASSSYGGQGGGYSKGGGGAGLGGAIFNYSGTVTITNSTISGNTTTGGSGSNSGSAEGSGGGVFNLNGSVTLLNSTIANNTATKGSALTNVSHDTTGGVGNSDPATVYLANTILSGTAAVEDNEVDSDGGAATITATAPNLLLNAVTTAGEATTTTTGTGSFLIGNPLLSSLASNGGPTQTMALQAGSPAIATGDPSAASGLTTDQRGSGYPRFDNGTVDIGAYEYYIPNVDQYQATSTVTDYTLKLVSGEIELFQTGTPSNVLAEQAPTATSSITIYGSNSSDVLTIDLSGGDPIPSGGLTFEAGTSNNGTLDITGGSEGTVTYNYTSAHNGSIVMSSLGTVNYTGLVPVVNSGTASDVIVNLPSGPNTVTLGDSGGTLSVSGSTIETTDFPNPTGSLTINPGSTSDALTVDALPDLTAALTLGSSSQPFGTVALTGAVSLASNNSLAAYANTSLSDTGSITTLGTGSITLNAASGTISITGEPTLSTVNGGITLNANADAATGDFAGLTVNGATITTSGTGDLSLTGVGGGGTANSSLFGVWLRNADGPLTISSTGSGAGMGTITLNGTGGAGTGSSNNNNGIEFDGIYETASTSVITSVSGAISLTGTSATNPNIETGIVFRDGAQIHSTGTGANAASVTLVGIVNGDNSTTAQYDSAISLGETNNTGPSGAANKTQITSVDGSISLTGIDGQTGPSSNADDNGIAIDAGASVAATGTGTVTLTGTATNASSSSGVYIGTADANGGALTTVTTNTGELQITGTSAPSSNAVYIGTGATVIGKASVSLNGDGSSTTGVVDVDGTATVYGATINLKAGNVIVAPTATVGSATSGPIVTTVSTSSLLSNPGQMVFNANGDLYVANNGNSVLQISPNGTTTDFTSPNPSYVYGVAFDAAGNLYTPDNTSASVGKYNSSGSLVTSSFIDSGLSTPDNVVIDSSGNIYVLNDDGANGYVSKYSSTGTLINGSLITGLNDPYGLAIDSSGDLFVGNRGSSSVGKYTASNGTYNGSFVTGLNTVQGLAVDASGNLYIANYGTNSILEVTPNGTVSTYASGISGPTGLAFDSNGDLYVASGIDKDIVELTPVVAASAVTIQSSVESDPMEIGGTNSTAVAGINLTNAELARIVTSSTGTITIGDSSQTGNITFDDATPATTAGAAVNVLQSSTGSGQINFNNTSGIALNGNTGNITLTAGTGGIVEASGNTTGTADIGNAATASLNSAGGIGISGSPLQIGATNLDATTSSNGNGYLASTATTTIDATGLNVGAGTVELDGGTFNLSGNNDVDTSANLNVNGATLVLTSHNQTVNNLTLESGSITGSTGVLTSDTTIQTESGSASVTLAGSNGLTQSTTGKTALSGINIYSGTTTVTGGTLLLSANSTDNIADSATIDVQTGATLQAAGLTSGTLTLANGQTLKGAGTVSGKVTATNGSSLSPGDSTGVLTTGAVTFNSGSNFNVTLDGTTAGTNYSQESASGTVTVNGGNLNLTFGFTPTNGETFIIVNNASGSAVSVNSPFMANGVAIPQGGAFYLGNDRLVLSYTGGSNGQDVTITVQNYTILASITSGDLVVTDLVANQNDTLTLQADTTTDDFILSDPNNILGAPNIAGATGTGTNSLNIPFSAVTGTQIQLQLDTLGGGNDSLTVDTSLGSFGVPGQTIVYDPGTGTNTLAVTGTIQTASENFNTTGPDDSGSLALVNGTKTSNVSYENLTSDTLTGSTVANLVFNLPGATNSATLGDNGTNSELSGANFATTTFSSPTSGLTINRGTSSDSLTVNALPHFTSGLTIGTSNNPFGSVTLSGAVSLASNNSLAAYANNSLSDTGSITTLGTGSITLNAASGTISITGEPTLSTVNGGITLNANADAATGDFAGLTVNGATITTSGTGDLSLTGVGGGGTANSSLFGVWLRNADGPLTISSTGSGAGMGTITLNGTGGAGTGSSNNNNGIEFDGIYETASTSVITSVSGAISLTGTSATNPNIETGIVFRDGAQIHSTGTGANAASVTLVGIVNGDNSTTAQYDSAISLGETNNTGPSGAANKTQITSVDGSISLTGIDGQTGPSSNADDTGIVIDAGASVAATGTGTVTLTGTATNASSSSGVYIGTADANSGALTTVTTNTGALQITGTGNTTAGGIELLSGGTISTTNAPITFNADSMNISAPVTAGSSNSVTLLQKTAGTLINLGGSAASGSPATLGLTNTELGEITAGTLDIGNTSSGTITVSAAMSPTGVTNLDLATASGNTIALGTNTLTVTGSATLNTSGTGGISNGGTGSQITAGSVTLNAGSGGIGDATHGLGISTTGALVTNTTTGNGNQNLDPIGTVNSSSINAGTGTVTLSGTGTLAIGANNAIDTAASINVSGATLNIGSSNQSLAAVTLTNGFLTGTTGVLTSAANFAVQSGAASAVLGGAAGLTKSTSGTVLLSGTNTYTGVTQINTGTIQLGSSSALGASGATQGTTVASGAVLDLNGQTGVAEPITINGTGNNNTGALTNSSNTAATVTGMVTLGSNSTIGGIGNITVTGVVSAVGLTTMINMPGVSLTMNNAANAISTLGVTAAQSVSVTDANSLILASSTLSGNLNVNTSGAITQTGALTVAGTSSFNAGPGSITLSNASNALSGTVSVNNSSTNNVTVLNSIAMTVGASTLGSGVNQLTAATGDLTIAGAFGTTGNTTLTTTTGNVNVNAAMTLGAGTLTVDSAANFNENTSGAITTTNNTSSAVVISAGGTGSANLGAITAGASGGQVTVTALNGAITNNTGSTDITANAALLSAANGIGVGGAAIDTKISNVAALNSNTGNIQIANSVGGLITITTLGAVLGVTDAGTGAGFIDLTNASPITVNQPVTDSTGGNITLQPLNGGLLTINANVSATGGNGNIQLVAGSIAQTAGTVSAVGNGTVTYDAGVTESSPSATLTMTAGTQAISSTGHMTLSANGNIALANVTTNSGNVSVISSIGAITNANNGAVNVTINTTTPILALNAGTGVGTVSTPILTAVANLTAAGGTGGVYVTNAGSLTVATPGVSAGGNIAITAAGTGGATFYVPASIPVASTGGTTTLTESAPAGGTLVISGPVTGGTVDLYGGVGNDTFNINLTTASPFFLNGENGNDTYNIYMPGMGTGVLTINDTGSTNSNDDVAVLSGTTDPSTYTINASSVVDATTGATLDYTSELASLTVNGQSGTVGDTFNVTPSPTTLITVNGNGPSAPTTPGDTLNYLTPSGTLIQNITYDSILNTVDQPVDFLNIESLALAPLPNGGTNPTAANVVQKYQFDYSTALTVSGYTGVLASKDYVQGTAASYGWTPTAPNVAAVSGVDQGTPVALLASANVGTDAVFQTDLGQPGYYLVTVTLGNRTAAMPNVTLTANGGLGTVTVLTNVSTTADQFANDEFVVQVVPNTTTNALTGAASGKDTLAVRFAAPTGDNFVLQAMEIQPAKLLTIGMTGPTGTVYADGATVDTINGYNAPPNTMLTVTASNGTILTADASPYYQGIQVMSNASGDFSFQFQRPLDASTTIFAAYATVVNPSAQYIGYQSGTTAVTYSVPLVTRIDFDGTTDTAAPGFISVTPSSTYVAGTTDFGWNPNTPVSSFNRGLPSPLREDGAYAHDATFEIRVDPTAIYSVRLYLGDPTVERDDVSVYFGTSYPVPTITPAYTVSTLANEFDTTVTTGLSSPSGILYIRIVGNGTLNNDFSIVGLDLWKTGGSGALGSDPGVQAMYAATGPLIAGPASTASVPALTPAALAPIVKEAIELWEQTGLSAVQIAALTTTSVSIADLASQGLLGLTTPSGILIDPTADGRGWFLDTTPIDPHAFNQYVTANEYFATSGPAATHYDLLTVVAHELGHLIGLDDLPTAQNPGNVMDNTLSLGERLLPAGSISSSRQNANAVVDEPVVPHVSFALAMDTVLANWEPIVQRDLARGKALVARVTPARSHSRVPARFATLQPKTKFGQSHPNS